MLTKEALLPLVNARLNRVLLIAQAALPEHQFAAFRRLILDEFGRAGLIGDLDTITDEHRQERYGQDHLSKEGRCSMIANTEP